MTFTKWFQRRNQNNTAAIEANVQNTSVVDPDPQGSGTFAGSGSVTRGFRIRVHIQKWIETSTKTIKKRGNFIILTIFVY
jgi:hypothetical protein